MNSELRNEANRTFVICVDTYEQEVMVGQFYCLQQEDEMESFHSLPQLLNGIEKKLNTINYPQSFTAMRCFAPILEKKLNECAGMERRSGRKATFIVKILYRLHTSWQGTITWLEGRGEQNFRSTMELIFLMDSALTGNQTV